MSLSNPKSCFLPNIYAKIPYGVNTVISFRMVDTLNHCGGWQFEYFLLEEASFSTLQRLSSPLLLVTWNSQYIQEVLELSHFSRFKSLRVQSST